MPTRLFGEFLARVVRLTSHDMAEILEEQSASGRRFGEIALSWGLCQPQHVWEAWANQLAHRTPVIDLHSIGVDAQAVGELPARIARRFGAVPVRKTGKTLVVAADEANAPRAAARLPRLLRRKVHVVVAKPGQVEAALQTYYPVFQGKVKSSG